MNKTNSIFKHLYAFVGASIMAASLSACSDTTIDTPKEAGILDYFNEQGEAYLCINLATTGSSGGNTRAEHEQKDHVVGTTDEDKINNALLVLFGGTNDTYYENLTFKSAYKLNGFLDVSNGGNDVSSSKGLVVKVSSANIKSNENLYAYVITNYNNNITLLTNGIQMKNVMERQDVATSSTCPYSMTAATTVEVGPTTTYKRFRDFYLPTQGVSDFVMTNSPLLQKEDGDKASVELKMPSSEKYSVMELPKIDTEKLFKTEESAKASLTDAEPNPTLEVFVERLVAKLQVARSKNISTETKDRYTPATTKRTKDGDGNVSVSDITESTVTNGVTLANLQDNTDISYSVNPEDIRWSTDNRVDQRAYNVRHTGTMKEGTGDNTGKHYEDIEYLKYNSSSYPAANRFYETAETGKIGSGLHRIYWSIDPDYDYSATYTSPFTFQRGPQPQYDGDDQMDYGLIAVNDTQESAIKNTEYRAENTMNEEGLTQDKTTRIIIRVPFSAGPKDDDGKTYVMDETFYTIPSDKPDYIYHDENNTKVRVSSIHSIQKQIISLIAEVTPEYQFWKTTHASGKNDYEDILKVTMINGDGYDGTKYGDNMVLYGSCAAKFELKGDTWNDEAKTAFTAVPTGYTKSPAEALHDKANDIGINCYYKGRVYYKVRIRHFPDTEVDKFVTNSGSGYDAVYPATNRAQNYLGRYGMVRNTWYTVTISGIKHIGDSQYDPNSPIPAIPDDELDNYISVRVNVAKWSQRSQENTL